MPAPDAASFRAAMGRLATGVTVVSTVVEGVDHAITANSVTSVSLEPPMALFCVQNDSRFAAAVLESGAWAFSVLSAHSQAAAEWFATRGRPTDAQMGAYCAPGRVARGPRTGCALLADALATVECRTVGVHPGGDHSIVVGEVESVAVLPPGGAPLLRYQGVYLS